MNDKKTVKSLEEFLLVLREHEIKTVSKFVCIKSDKIFTEEKFKPNPNVKMKILWYDSVPHIHVGCRVYACSQGKDKNLYQKKRYASIRDSKACNNYEFVERRKLSRPTKKANCPVKIYVSRMVALPTYKVSIFTSNEKHKMSDEIKGRIRLGEEFDFENVYSFNLPDETSHQNHIVAVTETMDPKVRSKIKELVSGGTHDISVIKTLLEQYVVNKLGQTDKSRVRFYPTEKHIINTVSAAKREIGLSKVDPNIVDKTNTVDPRVRWKIKNLVYEGIDNVSLIIDHLEEYVFYELGETDPLKSEFYPERIRIRKIASEARRKMRRGEIDLKAAKELRHPNHTAAMTEIIDPEVRSKIKEFISEGIYDISIIADLLEEFAVYELGETDTSNKKFFPQKKHIQSIVDAAKRMSSKNSTISLETNDISKMDIPNVVDSFEISEDTRMSMNSPKMNELSGVGSSMSMNSVEINELSREDAQDPKNSIEMNEHSGVDAQDPKTSIKMNEYSGVDAQDPKNSIEMNEHSGVDAQDPENSIEMNEHSGVDAQDPENSVEMNEHSGVDAQDPKNSIEINEHSGVGAQDPKNSIEMNEHSEVDAQDPKNSIETNELSITYDQKPKNSLEEFLLILREYEIKTNSKFVCIQSDKSFTEDEFIPTVKKRLQWYGKVPYYYLGRRVYACSMGKDKNLYQKKRYAEKRDAKVCEEYEMTERRKLSRPTKKVNCPVKITVSRMLSLPNFEVSKRSSYEKSKMSEAIKEKIEKGQEIIFENVYSFTLPDENSHQNHLDTVSEYMDPKVRSKIKELVSGGTYDISAIKKLLEEYVANELGRTDKSRGRFYPQDKHIRNVVKAAKQEMGLSKTDPNNANKTKAVDPKVRWKIKKLVSEGIDNIPLITEIVERYVFYDLGETGLSKTQFHPDKIRIRKIVNEVKRKMRKEQNRSEL